MTDEYILASVTWYFLFETTKVATSIFDYPYSFFCYLPQSCHERIIKWGSTVNSLSTKYLQSLITIIKT